MNDTTIVHEPPANLAALLVREIRYSRRLRLHVQYAREQRKALRSALAVAVSMLREKDAALDGARSTAQALRDELRRYVAAKVTPPLVNDHDDHHDTIEPPSAPGFH